MAELGMAYHADWVHEERPSPLITRSGRPMAALPYSYGLNDAPLLMRSHVEAEEYARYCIAQFDRLVDESPARGRMMCLPLHPFTIGQPHRIKALAKVCRTSALTQAHGSRTLRRSSTTTSPTITTKNSKHARQRRERHSGG